MAESNEDPDLATGRIGRYECDGAMASGHKAWLLLTVTMLYNRAGFATMDLRLSQDVPALQSVRGSATPAGISRLNAMSMIKTETTGLKYHPDAYRFVDQALRHTQRRLGRSAENVSKEENEEEAAHINGRELLDGIRELAVNEFGLMAIVVLRHWGVRSTDDFGRIVFDFIERGAMRKTDRDQLNEFFDVYDFDQVFDHDYQIDMSDAFSS